MTRWLNIPTPPTSCVTSLFLSLSTTGSPHFLPLSDLTFHPLSLYSILNLFIIKSTSSLNPSPISHLPSSLIVTILLSVWISLLIKQLGFIESKYSSRFKNWIIDSINCIQIYVFVCSQKSPFSLSHGITGFHLEMKSTSWTVGLSDCQPDSQSVS